MTLKIWRPMWPSSDQRASPPLKLPKLIQTPLSISTLQHKNKDEINMYNCSVRFGEVGDDWPLKCLLLSPDIGDDQQETALEDAQEALAHTAGIVLNYLIDQNIPHNILITDDGMTLYVIPRKFDLLIERVAFHTSFESLCGFVKFKNKQAYD